MRGPLAVSISGALLVTLAVSCNALVGLGDREFSDALPDAAAGDADRDADVPADTSTDVPIDSPAVGCARTPDAAFCDDFDRDGGRRPEWLQTGDAGLSFGGPSLSPPRALLAEITGPQTGGGPRLELQPAPGNAGANLVRISFALRVERNEGVQGRETGLLAFAPTGFSTAKPTLRFDMQDPALAVVEVIPRDGGPPDYAGRVSAPPLADWMRIRIEIRYASGTAPVVEVFQEGASVGGPKALDPAFARPSTPAILLGMTFSNDKTQSAAARFDDFVYELE